MCDKCIVNRCVAVMLASSIKCDYFNFDKQPQTLTSARPTRVRMAAVKTALTTTHACACRAGLVPTVTAVSESCWTERVSSSDFFIQLFVDIN